MEHAHPTPDPFLSHHEAFRPQTLRATRGFASLPATPGQGGSSTNQEKPLSLQQRRLQLRSNGFRAARLPSHRISDKFPRWIVGKDDDSDGLTPEKVDQENTPPVSNRRQATPIPSTDKYPSVLSEITNSGSLRNKTLRAQQRTSAISIFEDTTNQLATDDSPVSWYHDAQSTQQSPEESDRNLTITPSTMKLREIPVSNQTPPQVTSQLPRQVKGRKRSKQSVRKASFEASEYIEHLESQLQVAQEASMSPTTGRPLQEKIRALETDKKDLQNRLDEWDEHFDVRVKEAIEHSTAYEIELQRKIKALEEEVNSKISAIQDLEQREMDRHDLENLRLANEKAEREKKGLEDTNRKLERRNDVLTELLAQSPARSQTSFDLSSPTRDMFRRTPRPKSMMARVPPSAEKGQLPRPLSFQSPPKSESSQSLFSPEAEHQLNHTANDPEKHTMGGQSRDSGLGESCSIQSGMGEEESEQSSLHSLAMSPPSWSLSMPMSPSDAKAEKSAKGRSFRSFASGSTSLKPLVLPAITGATSQAPSSTSSSHAVLSPARDFSGESFDPTRAFLSPEILFDTPTQPKRWSSDRSGWAAEDALNALEGHAPGYFDSFEDVLARHDREASFQGFSPNPLDKTILEEEGVDLLNQRPSTSGNDRNSFSSLAGELSKLGAQELSGLDDIYLDDLQVDPLESLDAMTGPEGHLNPHRPRQSTQDTGAKSESFNEMTFLTLSPKLKATEEWSQLKSVSGPKPLLSEGPISTFEEQASFTPPGVPRLMRMKSNASLAPISRPKVIGSVARYSAQITDFRSDLTFIARRVIANAWRSQWGRLGRLSWWVLGLFLGRRQRAATELGDNWNLEVSARRRWEMAFGGVEGLDDISSTLDGQEVYHHSASGALVSHPGSEQRSFCQRGCSHLRGASRRHNRDIGSDGSNSLGPKPSWPQSLLLWGKFSFALMLAVGGAATHGPAAMLQDCEPCSCNSLHSEYRVDQAEVETPEAVEQSKCHRVRQGGIETSPKAHYTTSEQQVVVSSITRKQGKAILNAEQRSKQKLTAQRDMLAAHKLVSIHTPQHNADTSLDVLASNHANKAPVGRAQVPRYEPDDDDKENQAYDVNDTNDAEQNNNYFEDHDDEIDDAERNTEVTVRPRPIPPRQSIHELTWFQSLDGTRL